MREVNTLLLVALLLLVSAALGAIFGYSCPVSGGG